MTGSCSADCKDSDLHFTPPSIREGFSLFRHTSLRVGGRARYFAKPGTVEDVADVRSWARERDLSTVILGAGTNVLFGRRGYLGLVLSTRGLRGVRFEGTQVIAAAGEPLARLAWSACERGLSGFEWACGIPGTLGGAVVMNAGAHGGDIAATLVTVDVLTNQGRLAASADSLRLGYRTSAVRTGDLRWVVVEATVALQRDDPQSCLDRARSFIAERLNRFPAGASAGCIFCNPDSGPTAGELLDHAGCKGLRVGQAVVSDRHANVIINEGTGNAEDILKLIEQMKRRVLDAFGVELHEEVVVYP